MTIVRVALADDHPVVLAGIRALLRAADEVILIGEAETGQAARQLVEAERPDVAVLDVSLPGLNGLELARWLTENCPEVRVLALTVHEDRAYVHGMLQAGARGYLLKRSAGEELVRAVRAVAGGGIYLDPAVAGKALPGAVAPGTEDGSLSQREEEVLRLIARGLSNKEAAAQLAISTKTIETYKVRATEKLGLRSRAEIVRHGVARGWLNDLDAP